MSHTDLEEVGNLLPNSRTIPVHSDPGILSAYDYGDSYGIHFGYKHLPVNSLIKALESGTSYGYTELENTDEGFISLVRPVSKTEGTEHANR